jgi:hypothetical protein
MKKAVPSHRNGSGGPCGMRITKRLSLREIAPTNRGATPDYTTKWKPALFPGGPLTGSLLLLIKQVLSVNLILTLNKAVCIGTCFDVAKPDVARHRTKQRDACPDQNRDARDD